MRNAFMESDLRKNIEFVNTQFSGSSRSSNKSKQALQRKNMAVWKRTMIQKMAWLKQSQERFLYYSELFKTINSSKTGFITLSELKAGIHNLQGTFSDSISWEQVFKSMDTNSDG
jgi:hypothetical protein